MVRVASSKLALDWSRVRLIKVPFCCKAFLTYPNHPQKRSGVIPVNNWSCITVFILAGHRSHRRFWSDALTAQLAYLFWKTVCATGLRLKPMRRNDSTSVAKRLLGKRTISKLFKLIFIFLYSADILLRKPLLQNYYFTIIKVLSKTLNKITFTKCWQIYLSVLPTNPAPTLSKIASHKRLLLLSMLEKLGFVEAALLLHLCQSYCLRWDVSCDCWNRW